MYMLHVRLQCKETGFFLTSDWGGVGLVFKQRSNFQYIKYLQSIVVKKFPTHSCRKWRGLHSQRTKCVCRVICQIPDTIYVTGHIEIQASL